MAVRSSVRSLSVLAAAALAAACGDEPGSTHTITTTVTITDPTTVTITDPNTITNTVVDPGLVGGHFSPPLVELVELLGSGGTLPVGGVAGATHMHTSEILYRDGGVDRPPMLLDCSYTFAAYNATNPASASILAQGWTHLHQNVDVDGDGLFTPGTDDIIHSGTRNPGCTHLAVDDVDPDIVYTSHHGNNSDGDSFISGWDLNTVATTDPVSGAVSYKLSPVQLPMFYEDGTAFEAMDHENGLVYAAIHAKGVGVFRRNPTTNELQRIGGYEALDNAFDVLVSGDVAYVADGPSGLAILDVSDPTEITRLGAAAFPGTAMDLALNGTTLYVAAESGGLVSIDVSNPAAPTVASTVTGSGTALGLAYDSDRIYLAGWTDARVYDVTNPIQPTIIGGVRREVDKDYGSDGGTRPDINNRVLTVAGHGDTLFDGTWWTPYNYAIHADRRAPYLVLPETVQQLTFPGDLALGSTADQDVVVRNDGNEPLTVLDVWSDHPAFTIAPTEVRIDPGQSATLKVTFAPQIGITPEQLADPDFDRTTTEEHGQLFLASDDPTQPLRQGYLVGNAAGLGVGDALPETTALLPDGSTWSFEADALGSVTLIAYWATFCPVCAHELPDLESTFYDVYADQGLQIVALDADNNEALNPAEVWDYIAYMDLPFAMGIDEGTTYDTLEAVYDGGNPFPVDILVDKAGIIRYVSREYDPDGMLAVLPDLLAE
ncbi:MAG: redoxin domain-containing protein [Myxococcota bacterium]